MRRAPQCFAGSHIIARMTNVFGPFASTIGLLAYVSLLIQLFVFATEVNVVPIDRYSACCWPSVCTRRLAAWTARRKAGSTRLWPPAA